MTRREHRTDLLPLIIAVICLGLFACKAVSSMSQESATWDETHYFGLGKYLLQNRRWDVPGSILHPPLSYYLHSIPLLFTTQNSAVWKSDPARVNNLQYLAEADVIRGQTLLSSPDNRGDRLLILSRLMMVLTAVLLGCFVYSWSYRLYGRWSSIVAVVLYSFCPNILAHARLITPDIAVTAFSFITMYYFWRLLNHDNTRDAILGGVCLGLTLLSKYTGLLLFPVLLALMVAWRIRRGTWKISRCLLLGAIGIVVLLAGYGMNLKPFLAGIVFQWLHASVGHPVFFHGDYSYGGWWYYTVIAFLIKTPIPLLVALAWAGASWIGRTQRHARAQELFLLAPVAAVFVFFSLNQQSIGLRYVLPAFPFLFVFASRVATLLPSKRILTGICMALLAWYVGASSFIHPHYLAYFNELVGGPSRGYTYMVDSNLDWGQDLKGLKKYMDGNGISKIRLSYFGSDSPSRYGIAYDWLPSFVLPIPDNQAPDVSPSRWIAISATNLQGVYLQNRDLFARFRQREPVAVIGYSIFVYKIDD